MVYLLLSNIEYDNILFSDLKISSNIFLEDRMLYFLREDFDKLNQKIVEVCKRMEKIGKEIGESCDEGSDTWHDNFAFEEGQRQQTMWSNHIRELIKIRNTATIVDPPRENDRVRIGKTVEFKDLITNEIERFQIGSFMVFRDQKKIEAISYNAPLAKIIMGAQIGEIRKGQIAGKQKQFEILKIE